MTDELICNGVSLDLSQAVPVPISFAIADIKNLSNRKQSFSKEVTLPDTMNNNNFFRGAFGYSATEAGINFDATIKVNVILKKRGIQVLEGVIKLNKVTKVKGFTQFTCQVFSDSIDLFQLLSTINVGELDWSEYDHVLSRTNIKDSWTAPIGSGYYYPLIERGNNRVGTIWNTTDLYPYVYLREALLKCFEFLGLTWDSDFLDTTMFKSILFGFGGGEIKTIPPIDVNNRKVEIDNGDFNYSIPFVTYDFQAGTDTGSSLTENQITTNLTGYLNPFDNDYFVGVLTQDILGQYSDGEITIGQSGLYTLNTQFRTTQTITVTNGNLVTLPYIAPIDESFVNKIQVLKNSGVLFEISSNIVAQTAVGNVITRDIDFNINNIVNLNLISGDVISFRLLLGSVRMGILNLENVYPSIAFDLDTVVPITIDLISDDTSITDGNMVKLGRFLPIMKCSDLLLSAIRQFNLYISEQSNDGVVKIESLMPFYSNTNDFNDISELVDTTKPIVIKPAANEYPKNIIFTFKKATDFDNMRYLDKYEEEYGDMKFVQGSYYSKGDQKTELAWGTIVPFQISGTILVPRFIKIENNIAKPNAGPGRIMFRNGLKSGSWTFNDTVGLGGEFLTTYPCVHHFDNCQNPTMDLNFKLVNEVYYTATIVTSANCYSEYYSTFINEMTSPAGKIVNLSVHWNEIDIKNRDFGKLLMIDGSLFRLNLIKEFSADVQTTTEIELVKVLKARKRAGKQIIQGATSVIYVDNNIASPPNNTGEDTGVISAPINNPNFQTNLIIG
jgi:hypothetical protein